MSKINYVCATCGEDFTRRCSANRHNNHFHLGNGIIVRTLEYIIGRINGQFLPPPNNNNNLSTRIIRKWWHNKHNSSPFTGNNNGLRGSDGRSTTIPDQKGDIFGCGTVGQSVKSNNNVCIDNSKIASPYNINPPLQSPSSLSDKPAHTKQSDIFGEFQQRISKFAEIKTLLTPYLSHQDIHNMLTLLTIERISSGNDNFLDQNLIMVRQIVKFRHDLDQLSSPDLPLYMNNNNNLAATPRANSLIGNNSFIAQNSFQMHPLHSPLPPPPALQKQPPLEQQGQNFHPIFFYTFLRPPRSLDEISNIMRNISAKL
ncbi:MAG TPA: hypothetical protein VE524_08540 [Nitrososphaeraceae archaeon]|nr:hypothetical protein [Nitrososphaeraceae archaeon]